MSKYKTLFHMSFFDPSSLEAWCPNGYEICYKYEAWCVLHTDDKKICDVTIIT